MEVQDSKIVVMMEVQHSTDSRVMMLSTTLARK